MIRQAFQFDRGKDLRHLQAEKPTSEADNKELRQRLAIQERSLRQENTTNCMEDIL
jgi:hypothetical protein